MASTIQIVPKWKHSYVETFVYDNTEITDIPADDVSDAVKTMHIFRSSRGVDNLMVRKNNASKFAEEFGKTDYKKYGQALMMPYASLTGGASTSNMRLMPHDATYANSNLYAYYRIAEKEVPGVAEEVVSQASAMSLKKARFNGLSNNLQFFADTTGDGSVDGNGETRLPGDSGTPTTGNTATDVTETPDSGTGSGTTTGGDGTDSVVTPPDVGGGTTGETPDPGTTGGIGGSTTDPGTSGGTTTGGSETPDPGTAGGTTGSGTTGETPDPGTTGGTTTGGGEGTDPGTIGGGTTGGTTNPDIGQGEVEWPENPDPNPVDPAPTMKKQRVFQVIFRSTKISPEVDPVTNRLVAGGATGLRSKKDIAAMAKNIVKPIAGREVPADGSPVPSWNGKYIGTFYTMGRGVYGNNYRWRAVKNTDYEKDYNRELYTFDILNSEGSLSKVAAYVGSVQDCVLNETSVRIDDVLGANPVGTYPVGVTLDDYAIQDIYDAYVEFLEGLAKDGIEVTIPSYEEFDPLFGQYIKTSEPYEYYEIVSVDDDAYPIKDDPNNCVIDNSVGVPLGGGYDGLFSTFKNAETGETLYGPEQPITEEIVANEGMSGLSGFNVGATTVEALLYVKAFNGMLDRKILSTIRVPADYVCDGNYPYEAKLALAKLLDARWDCLGYFDMGLGIESFSQATFAKIKNEYDGVFKTNAVSKNVQKFQVKDPFSKRWVWVTQTYKIAEQFPVHVNTFGIQEAFAKSTARYTGIKADSVTPSIDLWENELMSQLAERRLNYIEAAEEDVYQRGMQNTSQTINSDLLEENNMHVLFWLKRHIEKDVFDHQYRFSDPAERATFRQVEKAKYENIIGTMVATLDIKFDMNEFETSRQIIHCYVEVTFRTISKQGIIEIDVNKRSYEATLTA